MKHLLIVKDLALYMVIWLARIVLRPFVKRPETMWAKEQYNCLNTILTYWGVDDIGYITTINLGCCDPEYEEKKYSELFSDLHVATRMQLQLYHRVATGGSLNLDWTGKDVLEVGCGRGGGSEFVARALKPKMLTGVDLSPEGVDYCKDKFSSQKNLQFQIGDAQNLPLPDSSYDIVLNVESSHCYPNFGAFLMQVRRVLKVGGKFCYCDVSVPEILANIKAGLPKLGLKILEEEDLTPKVLASLDAMSTLRKDALNKFPFFIRPTLANVLGQPGSVTNDNIRSGKWCYVRLVCERVA